MYVRTKDNIWLVLAESTNILVVDKKINDFGIVLSKDIDIKTADTIEELCDMFILDNEKFGKEFYYNKNGRLEHYRDSYYSFRLKDVKENKIELGNCNLYGAIWTDKGLIYVVKMNDKGEFELL